MEKFFVAFIFSFVAFGASANWEYGNPYHDDGGRITISFRGGIARPAATMKNELGNMPINYYVYDNQYIFANDNECGGNPDDCDLLATVDVGKLPVAKKYDSMSFAGGAAVGIAWGGSPNIRTELDWLHISESTYRADPLFQGETETNSGTLMNVVAAARAKMNADVISAMIYYDFFSGQRKPNKTMIPYIGAGFGYAIAATELEFTDVYRDLTGLSLDGFGTQTAGGTIDFYTSKTQTTGFALSGALGVSYSIHDGVFFDFGGRASYIPKIAYSINNEADGNRTSYKEKPIFSANDVIFLNVHAGLRFEF